MSLKRQLRDQQVYFCCPKCDRSLIAWQVHPGDTGGWRVRAGLVQPQGMRSLAACYDFEHQTWRFTCDKHPRPFERVVKGRRVAEVVERAADAGRRKLVLGVDI